MTDNLRTWFGADSYGDPEAHIAALKNDPRFLETRYLVEASHDEWHAQWCFKAKTSPWTYDKPLERIEWVQTSPGHAFEVGRLADMAVVVDLQWYYLDGALVCRWEPTSQVVDYRMIEAWLEKKLPNVEHRSNAANLHNILQAIREARK